MQSIRDEVNELKGFGFSETEARELVMIERRKNSEKLMSGVKSNVGFSPPTPQVKSNNSIVNSANVLVPTNKNTKLFLTASEKNQRTESYAIEIILQNPKISIKKKGSYQIETVVNNDVYTVLEHPTKKKEKTDNSNKKETIYESHVRAGLVKTLEVILPESDSFRNKVIGTEIFKNYQASEINLLKKKNPSDNISKDLVISGYTLDTIPSLQTCKEENLLVHSKNVHTLYFTVDSVTLFKADMASKVDVLTSTMAADNDTTNVNEETLLATREEEASDYRYCLRRRDNFYNIQAYKFCCDCLGLFLFSACGMKMGCGHYLCDSCLCRNRGSTDVCGGEFQFHCPEQTESGICGEIADLATADSAETLFRWRDPNFPALQRDYEVPQIDFGTPDYVPEFKMDSLLNTENVVIFDGRSEEQKVDTSLKTVESPVEILKKHAVVSFRTRDSYVEGDFEDTGDLYETSKKPKTKKGRNF